MHVKVGRIVSVINCHCFPFEKFYRTILYVRDCASSTNYIYMLYVVCYRMPFHITVPVHIFARSKVHLMFWWSWFLYCIFEFIYQSCVVKYFHARRSPTYCTFFLLSTHTEQTYFSPTQNITVPCIVVLVVPNVILSQHAQLRRLNPHQS